MSDIFISYKREEQAIARQLADAFESEGWNVWWDPKLHAGEHFDDVIEQALRTAKCVIVLWSRRSINSRFVKDEASFALDNDKLIPVRIEDVELPFRFANVHTAHLIGWNGSPDTPTVRQLMADVAEKVGRGVSSHVENLAKGATRPNPLKTGIGVWLSAAGVAAIGLVGAAQWLLAPSGSEPTSPAPEAFDNQFENLSTALYTGHAKWGKGDQDMGTTSFNLELQFKGPEVEGNYYDGSGDKGTMQLKLVGNSLVGDVVSNRVPGRCRWRGTLSADASKLDATYNCDDGEHGELSLFSVDIVDRTVTESGAVRGKSRETLRQAVSGSVFPTATLDLRFDMDSAVLTEQARHELDQMGQALADSRLDAVRVQIGVHTNLAGSSDYNRRLSQDRADAIREYLVEVQEIESERLEAVGFGDSQPLISERQSDPRNRRVVFRVLP